jgi:hypothetical protein
MQTAGTPKPRRAVFEDGLGKRYAAYGLGGEPLEVLALRDELTAVPSFERALRERVDALATFQHPSFARIRAVQRVILDTPALAVVTDAIGGARLSNVLSAAEAQLLPIDISAATYLIRQLVHGMALLHEKMSDMSHGALAPERLVITPDARLVVVDYALGAALEELHYPRERCWTELSIPLPTGGDAPPFDQRADVLQIGAVALALIMGRRLCRDEYPDKMGTLAERTWGVTSTALVTPLPAALRAWLARALQLDPRHSFASAVDARAEFDRVVSDADDAAGAASMRTFLAKYTAQAATDGVKTDTVPPMLTVPAVSAPAAVPAPPVVPPPVVPAVPLAPAQTTSVAPTGTPSLTTRHQGGGIRRPHAVVASSPDRHVPTPNTAAAAAAPTSRQFLADEEPDVTAKNQPPWWNRRSIAAAVAIVVLAVGGIMAGRSYLMPSAAAEASVSGTLVVQTTPAGALVAIDGKPRGVTPLTLALPPGAHRLEVVSDGDPRTIPFTITAGGVVSQFIELPKADAATGQLVVRSQPSGARVTIDGVPRGIAPLTIDGLAPGSYTVVLANDLGSVTQQVNVDAGATASLVVPMTTPQGAPVSGWIAVAAPVDVQVYEDTLLLGSSRSDRIMVAAGRHELDIVNETLGYRATRTVNVSPGQVAAVRLDWPKGSMSLNAQPWAEVWVDGQHVGETPIGNFSVPIGPHEVIFRHPELGERAVSATVSLTAPARLSVDLRKR